MKKSEVSNRQKGIGYLILKSGAERQVEWEIDLLCDGSLGDGAVLGDEHHLAAAAKDGFAKLRLTSSHTLAVAIDNHTDREASFTTLLTSSTPPVFLAQTIVASVAIRDGSRFSIEFVGLDSERLLVVVPTTIMRDYLPVLEKAVPPSSSAPTMTSFFQAVTTWTAGKAMSLPFVLLKVDDDVPLGLSPQDARELAAELIDHAKEIETRLHTAH
jgi:hypothetical protein